ncbi:hypothetical protein [Streptomyces sp. NPDC002537]
MTSTFPVLQTPTADSGNPNPNLVRDGGFQDAPKFLEPEYAYINAVAHAGNVYLAQWDYGSSGNNLGNDRGPRENYIDIRSHGYAFDENLWRDASHGSNCVDLIGAGDLWHGFVGQRVSGLIPGARYDVAFLAGAAFAQGGPHPVRMQYSITDGSSPYADRTAALDRDLVEVRPADTALVGGIWARYWEQHRRSFTAVSTEAYIRFADDTQLGFYSGAQLADVSVRLHDSGFSVSPSGDPMTLPRDGKTCYPGVHLQAGEEGDVSRQTVQVSLPSATGLQFVPENNNLVQLIVRDDYRNESRYDETLPRHGQTVTFENVDLALSGKGSSSLLMIAVKALAHGPARDAGLTFLVGTKKSASTLLRVQAG